MPAVAHLPGHYDRSEGDQQAVPGRHRADGLAHQHREVGGADRVGRCDGQLELAGGVLRMELVHDDALGGERGEQVLDVVRHLDDPGHPVGGAGAGGHRVVAGLADEPFDLVRHPQLEPGLRGPLSLAPRERALAGGVQLALLRPAVHRRPGPPLLGREPGQPVEFGMQPQVSDRAADVAAGGDGVIDDSHRLDPDTPLEETRGALDAAVRAGKALYVGISSYSPDKTQEAAQILRELGTPLLIHQPSYSMFNRWIEGGLLDVLEAQGIGCIAFSPLAQGLLTDRYLDGIPADSRVRTGGALSESMLSESNLAKVRALNEVATRRGQSLAQLALVWALRDPRMTSLVLGASIVRQLEQNLAALSNMGLDDAELAEIDRYATEGDINLWARSSAV